MLGERSGLHGDLLLRMPFTAKLLDCQGYTPNKIVFSIVATCLLHGNSATMQARCCLRLCSEPLDVSDAKVHVCGNMSGFVRQVKAGTSAVAWQRQGRKSGSAQFHRHCFVTLCRAALIEVPDVVSRQSQCISSQLFRQQSTTLSPQTTALSPPSRDAQILARHADSEQPAQEKLASGRALKKGKGQGPDKVPDTDEVPSWRKRGMELGISASGVPAPLTKTSAAGGGKRKRIPAARTTAHNRLPVSDREGQILGEAAETAEYFDSAEELEAAAAKVAQLLSSSQHAVRPFRWLMVACVSLTGPRSHR